MKLPTRFRDYSIHTHIAIAFSCLILCTTVILSYSSYRLSSDAVTESTLSNTTQLIEQVKVNIQTYISNMESISTLALSSANLKAFMNRPSSQTSSTQILKLASSDLESIVRSREDIASILFLGRDGEVVSSRSEEHVKSLAELRAQDWFQQAILTPEVVVSSSHVQHIFEEQYRWVVSISRQLVLPNDGGGVLLVDLNYNVINDLCQQIELGKRGYVYIVNPSGDMVYHPQQQLIYSELKSEELDKVLTTKQGNVFIGSGTNRKIYTVATTSFGWKIVGVTYPDELIANKAQMQKSAAIWGGLSLIIALAISVALSYALTKPLKNLELNMKKAERGNFDIRVDILGTNEISRLSRTFNIMIARIKELMKQIVQEQEMKRVSELKALQAQIQPHFLYNTLDSIIWMAESGKVEDVVEMTTALSRLLRSSISQGEELIPLTAELEHIRHYLTIQSRRYRNKFTYSIQVPEELGQCQILKLTLQPLVENAIYHGIKHKAEAGHIVIRAEQEQQAVLLIIEDDGAGMKPEQVRTILHQKDRPHGKGGVGVANVNHRLQLYFGYNYGLSFASEQEEGTVVTVKIPYYRMEE